MDEVERRRMIEELRQYSSLLKLAEAEKAEAQKEREEYVNRICDLKEKVQDLEEEVDAGHDLAAQLAGCFRQANDEVVDARTTIIKSKMLHMYEIGVKRLGWINTDGWWEECKDVFRGNKESSGYGNMGSKSLCDSRPSIHLEWCLTVKGEIRT